MTVVSLTAGPMIDRLRTIISYDRICVMDNGNTVEFDTPEVLHGKNGIFRAMCDHSNITLDDIRCARMSAKQRYHYSYRLVFDTTHPSSRDIR